MARPTAGEIKACCAAFYTSDWARLLLGESLHPGGLALTGRLGELLELESGQRVLDVAAGTGASALFLARRFGCQVVGVDYSPDAVAAATAAAAEAGLVSRVSFQQGDAEQLPFATASFDAVICECAFCTFPDKPAAAAEFARVLRPAGRVGLADLTRAGPLPRELQSVLGWIACLADARPAAEYAEDLRAAGFGEPTIERHDQALRDLVRVIRAKLLGAQVVAALGKLGLPSSSLHEALTVARRAAFATDEGLLGYTLLVVQRSPLFLGEAAQALRERGGDG